MSVAVVSNPTRTKTFNSVDRSNQSENIHASNELRKGDIYYADLSPVVGSEQGGVRLVVVIQNDVGNLFSPTTIVASISTAKKQMPTHLPLDSNVHGIDRDSFVLCEQIRTICKNRLGKKITSLDKWTIDQIDKKLQFSLGMSF